MSNHVTFARLFFNLFCMLFWNTFCNTRMVSSHHINQFNFLKDAVLFSFWHLGSSGAISGHGGGNTSWLWLLEQLLPWFLVYRLSGYGQFGEEGNKLLKSISLLVSVFGSKSFSHLNLKFHEFHSFWLFFILNATELPYSIIGHIKDDNSERWNLLSLRCCTIKKKKKRKIEKRVTEYRSS